MPRIDTSGWPDHRGNRHMKKPGRKVLVIIAVALTGLALAIAAGLGVLAAMDTINWIKPMVVGRISDVLGRSAGAPIGRLGSTVTLHRQP